MTPQAVEGHRLLNFASQIEELTLKQAKQTAELPFI